jgi:hypothetical protein
METKTTKKELAGLSDPTFEAIVGGLFRFASESQAVSLLQRLSKNFQIHDEQEPITAGECPTLTMWIHDFSVTEEEREKGFTGHFARLIVQKLEGGKFTIVAEKLKLPLAKHPMKRLPKRRNPNYGHHLVRGATRGKVYETIEELRSQLLQMHEESPETTIPGQDKIYFMLYSRKTTPPLKKVKLKIAAVATGGYKLELTDYVKSHGSSDPAVQKPESETVGKFSSMVKLQRKKRTAIRKKKPATSSND